MIWHTFVVALELLMVSQEQLAAKERVWDNFEGRADHVTNLADPRVQKHLLGCQPLLHIVLQEL